MGVFKRKKKEEVRASVGDADARAALSFGEMDVEELQAYLTRERAEFDAAVQEKKAEFEQYLEQIKSGAADQLYDPRLRITSGPGFKPIKREVIPPPPTGA